MDGSHTYQRLADEALMLRYRDGELPAFDLERAWAHTPAMGKAILFTTQTVRAPDTGA